MRYDKNWATAPGQCRDRSLYVRPDGGKLALWSARCAVSGRLLKGAGSLREAHRELRAAGWSYDRKRGWVSPS